MAGFPRGKEEPSRQERLKEITDQLEAGIRNLMESNRYREWMDTMSRFHQYSLNNTILIAMQKPDASHVASYTTWHRLGRQVNRGETGIKILAPAPYRKMMEVDKVDAASGLVLRNADGSPVKEQKEVLMPAFKIVHVFDIAQTSGKDLPDIGVSELSGDVADYDFLLEALIRASPVPVGFEQIKGGAKGYYHLTEKRIAIQEGMSQLQTIKTLIHESAHARLHGKTAKELSPDEPKLTRNAQETEAESIAYTICRHYSNVGFGEIDTSEYSFAYIASWSKGKDLPELKASLDRIRQTADEMITEVDGYLSELRAEFAWAHLTAGDVKDIRWEDSRYYPSSRIAEHTLSCEILGETMRLTYEVSQHDDGEGFVIHSDGKDIWELMPEPELRKLEPVLTQAVEYGHWQRDVEQAATAEAVRDVRYSLYETENLALSREQILSLHEAIDRKEAALTGRKEADATIEPEASLNGQASAVEDTEKLTAAMEAAGYTLDTLESRNDYLHFNGDYGAAMTMGSWRECREWLEGVVFDDPEVSDRVEWILHPDHFPEKEGSEATSQAESMKESSNLTESSGLTESFGLLENGRYRYYSTQRPVDMGTFPKPPDNKPTEIHNYDVRQPVEGGKLLAWGYLEYAKPLTEKEIRDYELKPAPGRKASVLDDLKARKTEQETERAKHKGTGHRKSCPERI